MRKANAQVRSPVWRGSAPEGLPWRGELRVGPSRRGRVRDGPFGGVPGPGGGRGLAGREVGRPAGDGGGGGRPPRSGRGPRGVPDGPSGGVSPEGQQTWFRYGYGSMASPITVSPYELRYGSAGITSGCHS